MNRSHKMEPEQEAKKTWNQEIGSFFHAKPGSAAHMKEDLPRLYKIWDISQKIVILMNNMLIAIPQNSNAPEQFFRVLPNTNLDPGKQPIFVGPSNERRSLSCTKSGNNNPQLQLVEKSVLDLYKEKEELLGFTFYSKMDGSPDTCSFESAKFPGWFLSTSPKPNKPVGLSQQGGRDNTLFYFERKGDLSVI